MLIELKRCNSIGNIDGLLFLVSMLSSKNSISRKEVVNRSSLENGLNINCSGALAFLEYLEYVEFSEDNIIVTERLKELKLLEGSSIIDTLVRSCISKLTDEGIFDLDRTGFDVDKGHISIKRSAFPLAYAAIRNFLTIAGALDKDENGDIGISETYESDFSSQIRRRKSKFTLEQLLKQQEEQSKRGLEAEEFILEFERKRLLAKAYKIKRISDIDVSAGYDIVSFQSDSSTTYDRFIEVKSYLGKPHFYWSENESDTARIKGDKYVLCLVDYARITEPGYKPEFIQNPHKIIFEDDNWLVNTASYRIQKI
ncbi:DUF3883 domain-containing protein [Bacillus licheniformis]|uniref:DUF3883 domain-containing protein n=2 Tax=Bacilli TaxID=91061 RepID=UPI0011A560CC|nr:DUF3883 domain-containing protein [Bacillus licheniformis]MDE1367174.1 DUF3883 domain-containing protein [Bacillus licheniformis]MDE1437406.1 DUF3883 domain-containing protein [Bacillus licheniformis]MEC1244946.1 DUF3883 domain-containing protein [Bacillus licheniformis]MEC1326214.1 DUF3883 domain-containing protein [Bacillus licheniformis]QPI22502.1 DUF3883 domain-containing protein [Bacillus licheniformis]